MIRKVNATLVRIGSVAWSLTALLLGAEVNLLPACFLHEGMLFRWQAWALVGILVIILRDLLDSCYCRACKKRRDLKPIALLTTGKLLCQSCFDRRRNSRAWAAGLRLSGPIPTAKPIDARFVRRVTPLAAPRRFLERSVNSMEGAA